MAPNAVVLPTLAQQQFQPFTIEAPYHIEYVKVRLILARLVPVELALAILESASYLPGIAFTCNDPIKTPTIAGYMARHTKIKVSRASQLAKAMVIKIGSPKLHSLEFKVKTGEWAQGSGESAATYSLPPMRCLILPDPRLNTINPNSPFNGKERDMAFWLVQGRGFKVNPEQSYSILWGDGWSEGPPRSGNGDGAIKSVREGGMIKLVVTSMRNNAHGSDDQSPMCNVDRIKVIFRYRF
ncbi:hypothetical protein BS50DRAFT_636268 [Corynespora cassiicola Philippines]|uniref:Uncharacterized protein n=1 Tax=Corynespora cassiicola Philippines TaxID=1448308 RepID=A0A2T2NJ93_CORCC|nr:hypothetical protein BS50DRAFT_636268 [Corynespora cassiicola Philippines]